MHHSALIRRSYYLYQLRDDFRDRRDFIRGRPNYVGGYEEWLARKASLESGTANPIEPPAGQEEMTRQWRNGGAWRRPNPVGVGRGRSANPARNSSLNANYRRDSSPNYGQYGPTGPSYAPPGEQEEARNNNRDANNSRNNWGNRGDDGGRGGNNNYDRNNVRNDRTGSDGNDGRAMGSDPRYFENEQDGVGYSSGQPWYADDDEEPPSSTRRQSNNNRNRGNSARGGQQGNQNNRGNGSRPARNRTANDDAGRAPANNRNEPHPPSRQEEETVPRSVLRHDGESQGPSQSRRRQRENRRRQNRNQNNQAPAPNAPFIEELPDEDESSDPPETPIANRVSEAEIDANDGVLMAQLHSVPGQEDVEGQEQAEDDIPTAHVTPVAEARVIPSSEIVTTILQSNELLRTYPNDHYELTGEAERVTLAILEYPEDFDFGMLDDLPMRIRITVAVSAAWHMMAIHNSVDPLHHKLFVNEIGVFLQWSVLEDMIIKDHVSRRIFRELKDSPIVVMDEFKLSPMKYAHLMLPTITVRSLNAPTVRPSTYHALFEAYAKRFYPDFWLEIVRAILSQHMTPAIFMRLAQTEGGFARWLRDESGVAVYQFNPPRINNLSRLQEQLDLVREEALDTMSRSSLPNLDYQPQNPPSSPLTGQTQGTSPSD